MIVFVEKGLYMCAPMRPRLTARHPFDRV